MSRSHGVPVRFLAIGAAVVVTLAACGQGQAPPATPIAVVDALPAEEREQTKSFLSQSLLGVVTQVLVRTPDLRGRKAICEVMVMNRAIGKLITSEQSHMIPSQLQTGRDLGMQTLDQALLAAVQAREVDPEDAFGYAADKRPFARYVPDGTAILKSDVTQGL